MKQLIPNQTANLSKSLNFWLLFIFLIGLNTSSTYAQQDAQFTQFMFNKLTLNPAYAGASYVPCLSIIHRQQWVGLEGSPVSSAINFNTPLRNKRVGLGFTFSNDNIGPTQSSSLTMSYAYRIHLEKGVLSLGLLASLRQYQVKWENAIAVHTGDGLVATARNSKLLPNAGLGLYYESEKFFFGASMPHLIEGDLSLVDDYIFGTDVTSIENQHFYLMAGFLIDINQSLKLKPAAILKTVRNAPLDMDFNLTFILLEKFWVGGSYRLGGSTIRGIGESLGVVIQYQVSKGLRLGAAYDFTLSEIKDYTSGSFEFYAQHCFGIGKEKVANPRFF